MAYHFQNTKNKNSNPDWQTKKRKWNYNKLSLTLLIFVSCCLTLILIPPHVQCKELYNATSKGENMSSNDHQSHQQDVSERNITADKTTHNGTFKRLQPTDIQHENVEPEEEDDDEYSGRLIETIQPQHTFRHQEHFKKRIILVEKHEQPPHENGNVESVSDGDGDVTLQERKITEHNRTLRYKEIQKFNLREPIAAHAPYLRRHEHHLAKKREKQTELTWPQQQHHLIPQHHQQQQQQQQTREFLRYNQTQFRHMKHEMRKQNITVTKKKQLPSQRYFDRGSSYVQSIDNMVTTEGPPVRHTGTNLYWMSKAYSNSPFNRLFNDEGNNNQKEEDIRRLFLSLDGHEKGNQNVKDVKGKQTLDEYTGNTEDDGTNYDADDNIDRGNDYSYEDDDNKEINKQKNYPSISTYKKTNVKRYTNPQHILPSTSFTYRNQNTGHYFSNALSHNIESNNDNNKNDDYDDDIGNIEDDTDELSLSSLNEFSDDDDADDKMSDEKWNKIEHEHYRKQLQHQRAMQALRSRRPLNDNMPQTAAASATASNIEKYASYSPSSLSTATSTYNAAWKKRQIINNETWADLKSQTKKKIGENQKSLRETGGRLYRYNNLTELEVIIDHTLFVSSAVAPGGKVFGVEDQSINDCFIALVESPARCSISVAVVTPTRNLETSQQKNKPTNDQNSPLNVHQSPLKQQQNTTALAASTKRQESCFSDGENYPTVSHSAKKSKVVNEQINLIRRQLRVAERNAATAAEQANSIKRMADAAEVQAEAAKRMANAAEATATGITELVKATIRIENVLEKHFSKS